MPPLVIAPPPPHMLAAAVDSAYMDLTSLREASDRSLLLSTTLLLSDSGKGCSAVAAFDVWWPCGDLAVTSLLTVGGSTFSAASDSFSSATFESGGGESQIEEEDDEAESASPELTPDELGVLQREFSWFSLINPIQKSVSRIIYNDRFLEKQKCLHHLIVMSLKWISANLRMPKLVISHKS